MIKIGNHLIFKIIFLLPISFLTLCAEKENIFFSKKKINFNETIEITISVINKKTDIQFQSDDFKLLPQKKETTHLSLINNQLTREKTIIYTLKPLKKGKCFLSIFINKKKKGPFEITVSSSPKEGKSSPSQSLEKNQTVIIKNIPSKKNFYINEGITVTTLIFYKINIENPRILKEDDLNGFNVEKITLEKPNPSKKQLINEEPYQVSIGRKRLIYPHYPGKFQIKGGEFLIEKSSFFLSSAGEIKVKASDMTLSVLPLPKKNKPKAFQNAVGDFSIEMSPFKKEIQNNQPINIKLTVFGKGNFKNLMMPEIIVVEKQTLIKKSKIKDNFKPTENGYEGEISIQYFLIPQDQKTITIEKIDFSFFSLKKKKYIQLKIPQKTINILTNPTNLSKSLTNHLSLQTNKSQSIHYLYTENLNKKPFKKPFFSTFTKGIHLLSFLVLTFAFYSKTKKQKNKNLEETSLFIKESRSSIFKQAEFLFKDLLVKNKSQEFLKQSQKIIFTYLTKKFQLEKGTSTYKIKQDLKIKQAPKQALDLLSKINLYQKILFSPNKQSITLKQEINKCLNLIKSIEEQKKI